MSVFRKAKIGKHDDVTVVEFGTGDVAISNGYDDENPKVKTLALSQSNPKPVEEYNNDMDIPGGNSDGLGDLFVLMKFARVESVDVLIKRLEMIKEAFAKDA